MYPRLNSYYGVSDFFWHCETTVCDDSKMSITTVTRRVVPLSLSLSNETVNKLRGKTGGKNRALLAPRFSRGHFYIAVSCRIAYDGLSWNFLQWSRHFLCNQDFFKPHNPSRFSFISLWRSLEKNGLAAESTLLWALNSLSSFRVMTKNSICVT